MHASLREANSCLTCDKPLFNRMLPTCHLFDSFYYVFSLRIALLCADGRSVSRRRRTRAWRHKRAPRTWSISCCNLAKSRFQQRSAVSLLNAKHMLLSLLRMLLRSVSSSGRCVRGHCLHLGSAFRLCVLVHRSAGVHVFIWQNECTAGIH